MRSGQGRGEGENDGSAKMVLVLEGAPPHVSSPYHKVFYTLFALALGAKLPDFMATVPFTRPPPSTSNFRP
jgi:hypothetical protein